jgi:hypothetical protein
VGRGFAMNAAGIKFHLREFDFCDVHLVLKRNIAER